MPVPGSAGYRTRGSAALDLALVIGLGLLTLAVARGWPPVGADLAVERSLPPIDSTGFAGVLLRVAQTVTGLASPPRAAATTLGIAALMSLRRRSLAPVRFDGVRVLALTVTVLGGKALLHRPGPLQQHVSGLHGYFPSGHTATALVCTVTLARLFVVYRPDRRVPAYLLATTWTGLVAGGLVLHRYHWLTDVLGAVLLGALVVRWTREYQPQRRPAGR